MKLKFTNADNHEVVVSAPEVTHVTVRDVERIGRSVGALDGSEWVDEPEATEVIVGDRYVTLVHGISPGAAESILRYSPPSTAELNSIVTASSVDDLAPGHVQLHEPYSVFDRLGGDDVEKFDGCGPHDDPCCPCEDEGR